jgi:ABC-type bacteriocin/lantibiotic exporter with double-glycine peptidase domain
MQKLTWTEIRQEVLKHKKQLIKANLLAIIATLVNVPIPLIMPVLVDEVLLGQKGQAVTMMSYLLPEAWVGPTAFILLMFVVVVFLRLLNMVFSILQFKSFAIVGKEISFKIREKFLNHLPQVKLQPLEEQGSAGLSSRCIIDIETIDMCISQALSTLVIGLVSILGTCAILIWIDWRLGLLILVLNPAMIIFTRLFRSNLSQLTRDENTAFEAFQTSLIETLDAINQLKSARKEIQYFEAVKETATHLKNCAVRSQWKSEAMNQYGSAVYLIGFEAFRVIAMLMVVFSGLSVGQMFAVFAYLWFMMGPIQELVGLQYSYYSCDSALERLNEVFQFKKEPFRETVQNPFETDGQIAIAFNNVSFAYTENKSTLKSVNLTIDKGQRVAIVSVSGGGKSTLVQLLLGLYEKDSGDIVINGVPVEKIGYHQIRKNISTVLQTPIIFNTDIEDNLRMGNKRLVESELWQALRMAELDDVVRELPQQLKTKVGKNGLKLSGGQRQRLAIARMILSNPKVVVLDEATSALDAITEGKIHQNLSTFLQDRTTIIIAHRLSAVKMADQIYVLDDGTICQSGSHKQLNDEEGTYQTLFSHYTL